VVWRCIRVGVAPRMGRLFNGWIHLELESTAFPGIVILVGLIGLCTVFVHVVEGWGWILDASSNSSNSPGPKREYTE